MLNDAKLEGKIQKELAGYSKIVLYGTGDNANYIMPFFEKLRILPHITAVVDRDESNMIGKSFYGFKVRKFQEVIEDIDAVVIASRVYWQEIMERLKGTISEYGIDIPIIAIFDYAPRKMRDNNPEDYVEYVQYLEKRQINREEDFVALSDVPYQHKSGDSKIIAWYLPQYYQMEINDKYHGKGFTEWTNSSQAIPLYVGHDQPHIPFDVGYYTLNDPEIMQNQINLAKRYGIYGFCFHYYWFSGQKTMEKPIYMFLEHKELDMPFCLNWATENWTMAWDGRKYDMIFEQKLNDKDDEKFMEDILPFFCDSRYIKIDEKPLFIIYTLEVFEKERSVQLVDNFRRIAKENGFPDLYILISTHNNFDEDVREYGADGLVEFPPSFMSDCSPYVPRGYVNPYFAGSIFDLNQYISEKKYLRQYRNKEIYRSALVSFDNTARKARWGGVVFHGASSENYGTWLFDILRESKKIHDRAHDYVFVNSWNEWAEGSHLEPDIRNGYAYLEATCNALYRARGLDVKYVRNKAEKVFNAGKNPHFYVLCIESMGDIVACEPIVRYLKEQYSNSKVTWIVKELYADIVENNPNIDRVKKVDCLSDAIDFCEKVEDDAETVIVDCHYNGRRCTKTNRIHVNRVNPQINERTYFNYGSLLENFCLAAGVEPIEKAPFFHEKINSKNPFKQEKYVVVHCKSAEECKDWQYGKWRIFVKKLLDRGHKVIEIGLVSVLNIKHSLFTDYTGKRDLQILAQIIKNAVFFLGVDSGFAHIANCYAKKSVILLGKYKNFSHPMPYTGYFREHQDKILLYAEGGTVKNITVEDVMRRWGDLNDWADTGIKVKGGV